MLQILTELDNDLAKIIWMSRPGPESLITHSTLVPTFAEPELLHITHALHHETNKEADDSHDIATGTEGDERVGSHVGRVKDGDGQRDHPHPNHLEDPETQEGEEFVTLVIETVILARLEDAV